MKPRRRWEVRVFGHNWLAARCGLPATPHQVRTETYRWRWIASVQCFLWNVSPSIAGQKFWATLHRAPPKLRVAKAAA